MKRLFDYADKYLQKSDWKDISMIKFCLFSMGILAGTCISEEKKGFTRTIAAIVFVITYILLMAKFFAVIVDKNLEEDKIEK